MKISPITNNNVVSKGSLSYKIETLTGSYAKALNESHFLANNSSAGFRYLPTLFSLFAIDALKRAGIVMGNLKTIMSRYGKTCELTYEVSKKDPSKHLFMIKSCNSDHVEAIGTIKLNKENYNEDFKILSDFTNNKLAMLDPYKVNLKFRTMRHENMAGGASFAPERKIWFIEDELKPMPDKIDWSLCDEKKLNPTIAEVWDELNKFKKEFNLDKVLFRRD